MPTILTPRPLSSCYPCVRRLLLRKARYERKSTVAASNTWFLNAYQYLNVSLGKRRCGIKYPQLYAEKAEVENSRAALQFNCAQRAHQNTLESIPYILLTARLRTALSRSASALCALWVGGRVLYAIGYSTGDPAKRVTYGGYLHGLGTTALGILSTTTAVHMVFAMNK